tara:strand:- start:1641 stop:1901 length:261 start_codon:yes stop_codon:yes gene_type:complete
MVCKFCESAPNEYWFSNWCESCRKIKNLANVYGFDRVLTILEKCCIRDENQLEAKIKNHKERLPSIPEELSKSNELYNKPSTRSKK